MGNTFRDRHGRDWTLDITVGTSRRIKSTLGINLLTLMNDNFRAMNELLNDPEQLVNVLYLICKPRADTLTVATPGVPGGTRPFTDEDFGDALAGDSLWAATEAFQEAFLDFFPGPAKASVRKMLAKSREVMGLVMAQADQEIDALDAPSQAKKLIERYGRSPGSSASTPTPSPSGS